MDLANEQAAAPGPRRCRRQRIECGFGPLQAVLAPAALIDINRIPGLDTVLESEDRKSVV